jgi:hypothetical protein
LSGQDEGQELDEQPHILKKRPWALDRLIVLERTGNAGKRREPFLSDTPIKGRKGRKLGNLLIAPKVQKIQTTLYEKAKSEPQLRFYSTIIKGYGSAWTRL